MKNIKIITLTIAFIGLIHGCSSSKEKVGEASTTIDDRKTTDSVQIRSTTNGNMSNIYPSN